MLLSILTGGSKNLWITMQAAMISQLLWATIQYSMKASLVLSFLEGVADEAPCRCNCAVNGAEDLIAHYIEAEIREALGETRGCLGWPGQRLRKVPAS